MLKLPRLQTKRLTLRLAESSDIPELLRYFSENDAHLSPTTPRKPERFFTEDFWRNRINHHHAEFQNDHLVQLFAFADNELVATTQLSAIARGATQSCNLGYGIAKKHEGKGLMAEAVEATIVYAFTTLNLHRISANHLPENERSARLLARLGFEREGYAKDYLLIDGQWRDHVLNSRVNPHWTDE